MNCQPCSGETKRSGKDRKGHQRYQCLTCKKTFIEPYEKPLDDMRLPFDKALLVLQLLVEGSSIRSTERITGVEKKTILSLLLLVGEKCERLLDEKIQNINVKHVQCDEIWGYVGMKEKTKKRQGRDDENDLGDAYCFVGMEQNTKLILAWHLGRRTASDAVVFTEKLGRATANHNFLISTDGFKAYESRLIAIRLRSWASASPNLFRLLLLSHTCGRAFHRRHFGAASRSGDWGDRSIRSRSFNCPITAWSIRGRSARFCMR
jgi:transposase-like protein/IS1 family transposase